MKVLEKVEKQFNHTYTVSSMALISSNDSIVDTIWEDQELLDSLTMSKRREDDELKDGIDQSRGTWDDVYRSARGLSVHCMKEMKENSKEQANHSVYTNLTLGLGRGPFCTRSLSKTAERSLLDAIEAQIYGDVLYFWARLDADERNPLRQDFWSFCDANCQYAFLEAQKHMYGIKHNLSSVPLMPSDGGTWSVANSWVLPTKSFLDFVMFSRMFVDALDAQFYEHHQKTGYFCLSLSKNKHCTPGCWSYL